MAQGSIFKSNKPAGKQHKKRKGAPVKSKNKSTRSRDKKTTGILHRNIENLVAAKLVKNNEKIFLKDIASRGQGQLEVEMTQKVKASKQKRDQHKIQIAQLQRATKNLTK